MKISEYQAHLRRQGKSERTIKLYTYALKRYARGWKQYDKKKDEWKEHPGRKTFNQEDVNDFLDRAPSHTVNKAMLRTLKEWQPQKYTFNIPKMRLRRKRLPEYYKDNEVRTILSEVDPEYKLVIWLMDECGLRVDEAVNVKYSQIDAQNGTLRVIGKGDKERIVYPSPLLISRLRKRYASVQNDEGLLFPSKKTKGLPIHTNTIRYHLKKASKFIGGRSFPHKFRHTFATRAYESTQDIKVVKDLLGHDNIKTTSIYAHVSNRLAEAAARSVWRNSEDERK